MPIARTEIPTVGIDRPVVAMERNVALRPAGWLGREGRLGTAHFACVKRRRNLVESVEGRDHRDRDERIGSGSDVTPARHWCDAPSTAATRMGFHDSAPYAET